MPVPLGFLLLAGEMPDQVDFGLAVGGGVGMQDLVKPHRRLAENIRVFPGFPGQISLGFAADEGPVDGTDAFLFGDWQYRVKRTADGTRHVFRADYRAIVFFQPSDLALEVFGPTVVVEGDDVGFAELNLGEFTKVGPVGRGVDATDSAGERLRGIGFPGPREYLWQKGGYASGLVFQLLFGIA